MNTLEGLLAGIVADPLEETRWLVLADWLEEFDDPRRAELLRLHRKMLATCCEPSRHPARAESQARIVGLIAEGLRPCLPQETLTLPGGVGMTFSFIPPGSFLMGSDHPEGEDDEKPVYRVTLTKGFFLGIHPVTQAQWRALTGATPSHFKGDNRPVENVSWYECQGFCEMLATDLGRRVTVGLPSEAEWEYACRAGSTTEFHFGEVITPDLLNYDGNSTWNGSPEGKYREETTEVGSFPANPWGLVDMHGNVWEWCQDWYGPYSTDDQIDPIQLQEYSSECRILRGGCWSNYPVDCRSASRGRGVPDRHHSFYGFRCVFRLDCVTASTPCHHGGSSSPGPQCCLEFGKGLADHLAGAFLGEPHRLCHLLECSTLTLLPDRDVVSLARRESLHPVGTTPSRREMLGHGQWNQLNHAGSTHPPSQVFSNVRQRPSFRGQRVASFGQHSAPDRFPLVAILGQSRVVPA